MWWLWLARCNSADTGFGISTATLVDRREAGHANADASADTDVGERPRRSGGE